MLITGPEYLKEELLQKFSLEHGAQWMAPEDIGQDDLNNADIIIDAHVETPYLIEYINLNSKVIILNAVRESLAAQFSGIKTTCSVIGMNMMPTMINRPYLEWAFLNNQGKETGQELAAKMGWEVSWVADRVGMVTPRILLMIINEAFYTLQEGTANKEDIDLGMKLGTAYPLGPFEWAEKIGLSEVYETLTAIYHDTGDDRYKACPLMKHQYLQRAG